MKLDLSPKLDFHGTQFGVGVHDICIMSFLDRNQRDQFHHAESKGKDPLSILVKQLREEGWDVKRLPYDKDANPHMMKVTLTIYMKDNQISKTP